MEYTNLTASCNKPTCGNSKEDDYDNSWFISPLEPDCEEHFFWYRTGEIDGDEKALKMIDLLDLNHPALVRERRALLDECLRMAQFTGEEFILSQYVSQDENGDYPRFCEMVRYFYDRGEYSLENFSG